MATSKKLYVAVASIIDNARRLAENEPNDVARKIASGYVRLVADALSTEFTADNPRFDRARFMTACGLT